MALLSTPTLKMPGTTCAAAASDSRQFTSQAHTDLQVAELPAPEGASSVASGYALDHVRGHAHPGAATKVVE